MTVKEAYKLLYIHFAPCGDETKQDEAVNVALKALKKQIPKKPIEEPHDEKTLSYNGQAIDYGEGGE